MLTSLLLLTSLLAAPALTNPRHGIVGGGEAEPHSIPWQVSLRRKSDDFHFCGASVVGPLHVVTAAHCSVIWDSPQQVEIVAGGHNNAQPDGLEQRRSVVKITVHEDYQNPKAYENDIAIWELDAPLVMDDRVQAVGMPEREQESEGSCDVSGWGTLTAGGQTPDELYVVSVPVVTEQRCKIEYPFSIATSMICAGERGKDSCQGDSGGPLVCYNPDGSSYLGGVVSWGIGCGGLFHPGVYTEVSYFVDWITSKIPATTPAPATTTTEPTTTTAAPVPTTTTAAAVPTTTTAAPVPTTTTAAPVPTTTTAAPVPTTTTAAPQPPTTTTWVPEPTTTTAKPWGPTTTEAEFTTTYPWEGTTTTIAPVKYMKLN